MPALSLRKEPDKSVPDIRTREGFKQIYALHAAKVYSFCLSYSKNEELAKDVVQEVFAALWEKRNTIELKGSVEYYLISAAMYRLIDHYSRTERRRSL